MNAWLQCFLLNGLHLVKYKIAYIVNHFPSVSETFILNQITDMVERGHDVKVFAFRQGDLRKVHRSFDEFLMLNKTTVFRYPGGRLTKLKWQIAVLLRNLKLIIKRRREQSIGAILRERSVLIRLEEFLHAGNFDIVHAHFGHRGTLVAEVCERMGKYQFGFITSFHGYDLNPRLLDSYKDSYRLLLKKADVITVNSVYLGSLLARVNGKLGNVIVLPEGLRTSHYRRQPRVKEDNNLTLLFCGRLVEFKGPDLAVRILSILINDRRIKNIKLRMIGEGPLRTSVETLIHQLGVSTNVALLGSLTQEEVIREMSDADIFFLPGIYEKATGRAEAQGLVVQEAQAMELPVIVSDSGGTKYGLLDNKTGFVVPEKDLVTFADKIELLVKDESLRRIMGREGREYVVRTFDTRKLGDELLQLYEKALKKDY